jgi:hypothetical protein
MAQSEDLTEVCTECCAILADERSTMAVIASDPGVGLTSGDLREDLRTAQNHGCWRFRGEEALHASSDNKRLPTIPGWSIVLGITLHNIKSSQENGFMSGSGIGYSQDTIEILGFIDQKQRECVSLFYFRYHSISAFSQIDRCRWTSVERCSRLLISSLFESNQAA